MIVIEGTRYGKSNANDITHACATQGKGWERDLGHVMGYDMKEKGRQK